MITRRYASSDPPLLLPRTNNLMSSTVEESHARTASDTAPLVLVKYGGNAMKDDELSKNVVASLAAIVRSGIRLVLVHGGGPFIEQELQTHGVSSEFVSGHRVTTEESLPLIEMALKGLVNSKVVGLFNREGLRAVGLSGKDGKMITVERRYHVDLIRGEEVRQDIGLVGDVIAVDTGLVNALLADGYVPVITCIACDENGTDYNVNADMLAGHLAGALSADDYVVLTDVDGLMIDPADPGTVIADADVNALQSQWKGCIVGGMIPKVESCIIALRGGVQRARIINGTMPQTIHDVLVEKKQRGTTITL